MRRCLAALLSLSALLLVLLPAPASAKYFGADPPLQCACCNACAASRGTSCPTSACSSSEPCASGTCFSRTEGNASENYRGVSLKSASGAPPTFALRYDSYNADTSRARIGTILGNGWTHSYNIYLYSVRGHLFRVDADGRITKYKLGPGGTYTAAAGYFETLVKNPDGTFTLTQKDKTV